MHGCPSAPIDRSKWPPRLMHEQMHLDHNMRLCKSTAVEEKSASATTKSSNTPAPAKKTIAHPVAAAATLHFPAPVSETKTVVKKARAWYFAEEKDRRYEP